MKKWIVSSVGAAGGGSGAAGIVAGFTLTEVDTGITKRLRFLGAGVGEGVGGSWSFPINVPYLSASGEFYTKDFIEFKDFNCAGEVTQASADAFVIGYSIGWMKFNGVITDPEWISTRGLQGFGVALSAIATVGRFQVLD